ncbi:MAG: UPF0147 family protein [Candidatus Thermoplasmatota archaeon]|jgi:uncharacterized protein (UPF0147 family)|nr:UPF0147 family protein [Candidatus Thermoplasmatota archaeon]MCL5988293.1 UPF0147 family protein [Candidatus Thermoplasmatota archaeon]
MDKRLFDEVVYLLDEMSQDTSVPKNVRKNAQDAKMKMDQQKMSLDIRCASAIAILDESSNDPNVPSHGRAELYTVISKLESLAKS